MQYDFPNSLLLHTCRTIINHLQVEEQEQYELNAGASKNIFQLVCAEG